MDLELAKKEFLKFTGTYSSDNPKIALKTDHSLNVMDVSNELAKSLDLDEENIYIATLIGLLHDTGRFEQIRVYNTFSDFKSVDHGKLGKEILEKDDFLHSFIDEGDDFYNKYKDTILVAIENHNKFKISPTVTDENILMHCKIIRDADKIDIVNIMRTRDFTTTYNKPEIKDETISDYVFNAILNDVQPPKKDLTNNIDRYINMVSFIFDINYKKSFMILKEKKYLNDLLDRVTDEKVNPENAKKLAIIREKVNSYIDKKIKGI